jgi:acetyl esterase
MMAEILDRRQREAGMAELHPQAKAALAAAEASGLRPWNEMSVADARVSFLEQRRAGQAGALPVRDVIDRHIKGPDGYLPMRVYRPRDPAATPPPVYVHFHGGGWVLGNLDSHDVMCRNLCATSGAVVVSVDYRLAPEAVFPKPLEDAWSATRWVADNGEALGVDSSRLGVGGDSAGGNLAAAVCRRARDAGGPAIGFQLLMYPCIDLTLASPTMTSLGKGYRLTRDLMAWFVGHYLADPAQAEDPDASPIRASTLAGLPPTLVATAGFDPLVGEGKAYADALAAAGVPVEYVCYEGMIHGFFNMPAAFDDGRRGLEHAGAAIRSALVG